MAQGGDAGAKQAEGGAVRRASTSYADAEDGPLSPATPGRAAGNGVVTDEGSGGGSGSGVASKALKLLGSVKGGVGSLKSSIGGGTRNPTSRGKNRASQREPAHASISMSRAEAVFEAEDEKRSPRLSLSVSTLKRRARRSGLPRRRLATSMEARRGETADGQPLNDWGLTAEEERLYLEEFQEELSEVEGVLQEHLADEKKLLRFLKARNFRVDRAAEMYLKHLRWREEWGVDDILFRDFPERDQLLEYYPQGYHMCDKQGRPIYIQYLGGINVHKVLSIATEETVIKLFIQEYEKFLHLKLPACSEASGRLIETSLNIMDVSGISLKVLTKESQRILKAVTGFTQDNYPEMMGNMIIINAPYIFKVIYNIIKPMLSPRTQSKITVLGTRYLDKLLEYVDAECIPEKIGGTSKYTIFDDIGPWSELAPSITTGEQLKLYQSQQMLKWKEGGAKSSGYKQSDLSELNTIYSQGTDLDTDPDSPFWTTREIAVEEEEGETAGDVVVEVKPSLLEWMAEMEGDVRRLVESRRVAGTAPVGEGPPPSLVARLGCLEAEVRSLQKSREPSGSGEARAVCSPVRVRDQPTWIASELPGGSSKPRTILQRMAKLDSDVAVLRGCLIPAEGPAAGKECGGGVLSWLGFPGSVACCFGTKVVD